MTQILKGLGQIASNLGQGINQAALGAASTSPLWAAKEQNDQRVALDAAKLKQEQLKIKQQQLQERAQRALDLAIRGEDTGVLVEAVKGGQAAGIIDIGMSSPEEFALSLIPPTRIKPEVYNREDGSFWYADPVTGSPMVIDEVEGFDRPTALFQSYGEALQDTAQEFGYDVAKKTFEARLGRPLTQEEAQRWAPILTRHAPINDQADGLYQLLVNFEPEERSKMIWEGLTPTQRGELLSRYGLELDVQPPIDPMLRRKMIEAATPLKALEALELVMDTDPEVSKWMGPVSGAFQGNNPFSVTAGKFNARMMLVTQLVGKYLEGGVLRQEDTIKYRKILPKFSDLPEVARAKIKYVTEMLQHMKDMYANNGVVGTETGPDGQETEVTRLPDLPFSPYDPSVATQTLTAWVRQNPDSPLKDDVMRAIQTRLAMENDVNKLNKNSPTTSNTSRTTTFGR